MLLGGDGQRTELDVYSPACNPNKMSRNTTALVVREVGGPFALETIELDKLGKNEALVEIHATGICHTDLSCASGRLPAQLPAVFGHEGQFLDTRNRSNESNLMVAPQELELWWRRDRM